MLTGKQKRYLRGEAHHLDPSSRSVKEASMTI